LLDKNGIIQNWNKGAEKIKGYKAEEVIGRNFSIFYTPEDQKAGIPELLIKQAIENGNALHEGWRLHANGTQFWGHVSITSLHNKKGEVIGFTKITRDLTEKRTADQILKEGYERILRFVEHAPSAIAMFDTNMCYVAASQQWFTDYKILGKEIIGKSHYEVFPEIGEDWKEIHRKCMLGHIDKCDEACFKRANGTEQWLKWEVRPWYVGQNVVAGIIMYTADITADKLREREKELLQEELKISEEKFRGSFEYSAIGMALVLTNGQWLKVNKQVCQMLGYTENELLSKTFQDITHPDDLESDLLRLQSLLAGRINTYQMEKRYYHKNGSIIWVLLSVSLIKDTDGNPLYFVSQIEDISNRKKAEEELKKVNRELTAIFNSGIYVSIIGTNPTGTITHFSKGAENLLGYSADEMIGKQKPSLIHIEEEIIQRGKELSNLFGRPISGFDVFVEYAKQGKHESREWTYRRKDGTTFPVQLVVNAIKNEMGEITGYVGIATDLTEQKLIEENRLKYAEIDAKNKELEQFTFIASHDLQEPLRTISNFAGLLSKQYAGKVLDENADKYLHYMIQSASRMKDLITGLLYYSRIGKERVLEIADCNLLINEVLADLTIAINESGAQITVNKLPQLHIYASELKQLFQNLISNAIKFNKPGNIPQISISAQKVNGIWQFAFKDNGIGIEPVNFEKIFIIFQRLHNKSEYEGTGIGLAHCKKIVELHNGKIWINSAINTGSTFFFTINTHPDEKEIEMHTTC
jgi:PAS domain S-box-containing protein